MTGTRTPNLPVADNVTNILVNYTDGTGSEAGPARATPEVLANALNTFLTPSAYTGTSTSSVTIETGSKSFTTQAGLPYFAGQRLMAAVDATNWVEGVVSSFTGGVVTLLVDAVSGSGTYSNWTLGPAGQRGAAGPSAYAGTSTSSVAIGVGTKTFTTQSGLAYFVGQRLIVAANATAWMEGVVTSYSSTTLVLSVDATAGSGTFASWAIGPTGQPGSISNVLLAHLGSDLSDIVSSTAGITTPDLPYATPANQAVGNAIPTTELWSILDTVSVKLSAAGTGEIHTYVPDGLGNYTLGAKWSVSNAASGVSNFTIGALVPAGTYVVYRKLTGGNPYYASGGAGGVQVNETASPNVGDAGTIVSYANTFAVAYTVRASASNVEKRLDAVEDGSAAIFDDVRKAFGREFTTKQTLSLGDNTVADAGLPFNFIYAANHPVPAPGVLGDIRYRTVGVSSGFVLIMEPTNATSGVYDQSSATYKIVARYAFTAASGANTFTSANGRSVKKGTLIAFYNTTSNGLNYAGGGSTLRFSASSFGAVGDTQIPIYENSTIAISYDVTVATENCDSRLDVLENRQKRSPLTLYAAPRFSAVPADWDVSGGTWTSSGGALVPPAGGSASTWAVHKRSSTLFNKSIVGYFTINDVTSQFGLCTVPSISTGGVVALIDPAAALFKLHYWTGGPSLGALGKTVAIPAGMLVSGMTYQMSITRAVNTVTISFTNCTTLQTISVSEAVYEVDGNLRIAHGRPGFIKLSGDVVLKSLRVTAPHDANSHVLIIGDSICEGFYLTTTTTIVPTWARLFATARSNVVISAQAGSVARTDYELRKALDVLPFSPRYAVFAIGTNDDSQSSWRNTVKQFVIEAQARGAEPVFVTQVPRADGNRGGQAMRTAMNNDIRSGYFGNFRYADLAVAVSANGDGVTWDAAYSYGDNVHPNAAGHVRMWQKFQADLPDIASA